MYFILTRIIHDTVPPLAEADCTGDLTFIPGGNSTRYVPPADPSLSTLEESPSKDNDPLSASMASLEITPPPPGSPFRPTPYTRILDPDLTLTSPTLAPAPSDNVALNSKRARSPSPCKESARKWNLKFKKRGKNLWDCVTVSATYPNLPLLHFFLQDFSTSDDLPPAVRKSKRTRNKK